MPHSQAVWNTKKSGVLHFLIYKEENDYVGVCLNLDIVEYGRDPELLTESIEEAARSHIGAVIKHNLSDDLLNKPAEAKYWKKLKQLQPSKLTKKPTKSTRASHLGSIFQQITKPYPGNPTWPGL